MITRGKESEVAYIAGLFDGEGNINIYKVERTSSKGPVYDLTIAIYSTNREVIDWLYGLFGGYVQTKNHLKNSGYKSHWKECYSWRLSSNQAQDFLRLVYPYLRIKKISGWYCNRVSGSQTNQKRSVCILNYSTVSLLWFLLHEVATTNWQPPLATQ